MPGPELHLNAINAALHSEFIAETSPLTTTLVTIAAGIFAVMLSVFIRSPWFRLLALAGTDAVWAWVALYFFNHASIYLPTATPGLQLHATVLLGLAADFARADGERSRSPSSGALRFAGCRARDAR